MFLSSIVTREGQWQGAPACTHVQDGQERADHPWCSSCRTRRRARGRPGTPIHMVQAYLGHQQTLWQLASGSSAILLTLSLPYSKSTFSQHFKDKCISDVIRIGSIIFSRLSELWKPSSSYRVMLYFWWVCRGNFTFRSIFFSCSQHERCNHV